MPRPCCPPHPLLLPLGGQGRGSARHHNVNAVRQTPPRHPRGSDVFNLTTLKNINLLEDLPETTPQAPFSVLRVGVVALPDPAGRRGAGPAPFPALSPRGGVAAAAVPAPAPAPAAAGGAGAGIAAAAAAAAARGFRVVPPAAAVPRCL